MVLAYITITLLKNSIGTGRKKKKKKSLESPTPWVNHLILPRRISYCTALLYSGIICCFKSIHMWTAETTSWHWIWRAAFFTAQMFHQLRVQPDPTKPPYARRFLFYQGGRRWEIGITTHSNQQLEDIGVHWSMLAQKTTLILNRLLQLECMFKRTEHTKMTLPCMPSIRQREGR